MYRDRGCVWQPGALGVLREKAKAEMSNVVIEIVLVLNAVVVLLFLVLVLIALHRIADEVSLLNKTFDVVLSRKRVETEELKRVWGLDPEERR